MEKIKENLENKISFLEDEEAIKKNEEQIVKVEEDDSGERIDSYLSKKMDLTRTRIKQLIKDENILVNGKKAKPAYKVERDDEISVIIPELEDIEINPENIPINIVYEDSTRYCSKT